MGEKMMKIIMKELTPFPILQYELLEKVILEREKGEIIENEYLVMNLTLLSKLSYKKEVF